MLRLFLAALCLQVVTLTQVSAAPPQGNAASPTLTFAVTSVRPGRPAREQPLTPLRCKGVDGEAETGFGAESITEPGAPPQGRCTGANVPLIALLATAYGITDGDRIIGIPDIGAGPTYQIQSAAEDPSRTTNAELQQMLQNLLIDRFKAKVRRETRERDGFVLTIAKSGIKFSLTAGDAEEPSLQTPQGTPLIPLRGTGPGGSIPIMVKGRYRMSSFAVFLKDLVGRMPVADKTSLPGLYDITLLFDLLPSTPGGQRGQGRGGLETSPPLPKALEDQLGLHLEPGKVREEFLIVEHIDKPTEN